MIRTWVDPFIVKGWQADAPAVVVRITPFVNPLAAGDTGTGRRTQRLIFTAQHRPEHPGRTADA